MTALLIFSAGFIGFLVGYVYRWRGIPFSRKWKTPFLGTRRDYSIALGRAESIDSIHQSLSVVLTRYDIHDANTVMVADPFLFFRNDRWHMFMEVVRKARKSTGSGEIGMAVSDNGIDWSYKGIVLREKFHLSYPYVFSYEQCVWMIPETGSDRSVRLYRAEGFPRTWRLEKKLLTGKPYTDASVFQHDGMFWMFVTCNNSSDLLLYFAEDLLAQWHHHPQSPVAYFEPDRARCAGRVVQYQGHLIRFAQDCSTAYGKSVYAHKITCLTPESYSETRWADTPILFGTGQGWNADGMHHIDLHQKGNGEYLAAVDGYRIIRDIGIKY